MLPVAERLLGFCPACPMGSHNRRELSACTWRLAGAARCCSAGCRCTCGRPWYDGVDDTSGDHALTCMCGGDRTKRRHVLRNTFAAAAGFLLELEKPGLLLHEAVGGRRPADVYIPGWGLQGPAAIALAAAFGLRAHTLTCSRWQRAGVGTRGHQMAPREDRRHLRRRRARVPPRSGRGGRARWPTLNTPFVASLCGRRRLASPRPMPSTTGALSDGVSAAERARAGNVLRALHECAAEWAHIMCWVCVRVKKRVFL